MTELLRVKIEDKKQKNQNIGKISILRSCDSSYKDQIFTKDSLTAIIISNAKLKVAYVLDNSDKFYQESKMKRLEHKQTSV